MDSTFRDILKQVTSQYNDHLQKRFEEMPVGAVLCVHDRMVSDPQDDWKVVYETTSHILIRDEDNKYPVCSEKGARQYGPKGE